MAIAARIHLSRLLLRVDLIGSMLQKVLELGLGFES